MKAAALTEPGRIEIIDLAEPECGPHDVLVRTTGVGLCGTDADVVHGARTAPRFPWVLGHEGAGEIVALGSAVRDRQVGMRVAVEPNYCCLRCASCTDGFTSGCAHRAAAGLNVPGLLAERVAVPAEFAHPVAGHVSITDLVCAEPLAVARTAVRRSGITPGEACLVVGAGSQGLFLCLSLLAAGAVPHVLEPHAGRRDLALSLGAEPAAGDGTFRHVFEAAGSAVALAAAVRRAATGGRITLVGMSTDPLELTPRHLVHRQLSLTGSLIYDHPGDFAGTVAVLERGTIAPHRVLQAEFPLEETGKAFAAIGATPGKCWINVAGPAG